MADKKIIAVVGATGQQGSGLVKAILADPSGGFAARAITRDPNSDKAKELARLGAEVVAGDVDDEESLKRAFAGAYGAYCVTFFWAHFSPEKEKAAGGRHGEGREGRRREARHLVHPRGLAQVHPARTTTACRRCRASTRCRTSTPRARPTRSSPPLGVPTTFLLTSFYWENFIYFGMGPKKGPDGVLGITMPLGDKKFPGIASDDIGACAYGIFKARRCLHRQARRDRRRAPDRRRDGRGVLEGARPAGAVQRGGARGLPRASGSPARTTWATCSSSTATSPTCSARARSLDFSRGLNPGLKTFSAWLGENKGRIPLE